MNNNSINILIADDQSDKANDIRNVIKDNFNNSTFDYSVSYNSTNIKLKKNDYDMIILDMSMPNFDPKEGKQPALKALAGKDIMVKMKYRNINIPVIIVTQFDIFGRHSDVISIDDLISGLELEFPDIFHGCIFYNTQSKLWEKELVDVIGGLFL